MYESSMAAGRFAPARFIEEEQGLIDFGSDYSPRLSAVYDLFGDGRTALKTSWSKYFRNYDGDIAAGVYGKAGERSENPSVVRPRPHSGHEHPPRRRHRLQRCGAKVLPSDCDGVAQDNEIGTSPSNGNFSAPTRADRTPVNLQRQYNYEFTAGVQHQVLPRLAVGAMFYKRKIADMWFGDRPHITLADYSSFVLPLPATNINRDPDVAEVVDPNQLGHDVQPGRVEGRRVHPRASSTAATRTTKRGIRASK